MGLLESTVELSVASGSLNYGSIAQAKSSETQRDSFGARSSRQLSLVTDTSPCKSEAVDSKHKSNH